MHLIPFLSLLLSAVLLTAPAPSRAEIAAEDPAAACIACRANLDTLRAFLSAQEWAEVMRGEITTSKVDSPTADDNKESMVQGAMMLPAAAPEVWGTLIDFGTRPRYVPAAKKIEVVRRDGNELWVDEYLNVVLMTIYFRTINTLDPKLGRIRWRLDHEVKNDIADTTGSWQIAPFDDQQTFVLYQARVESGQHVPRFIEDALTKRSLPKMMRGLRQEIARRFPTP